MPSILIRIAAAVALLLIPATAQAKRLALVVGIDTYEALPKLERAVNDADAVGAALQGLGFDVVIAENASRRAISTRLTEIETRIEPGDTVLFYFAGHGVALGADNILIPADMPLPETGGESIVRDEGFSVDNIVRRLRERGTGATLLILDACRNNPFEAEGTRAIGGTRGLTRVEAASGVFVLMSAGSGQTALDRLPGADADPNSVFTRSLLPLLKTPGMNHITLAKSVQKEVARLAAGAGHAQQPAYYDEILGEIVLNETAPEAAAAAVPQTPETNPALAEWTIIKDTKSTFVLQQFIDKYGDVPIYGALAQERLSLLIQSGAEFPGSEETDNPSAATPDVAAQAPASEQTALAAPETSATPAQAVPITECDRLAAAPGTAATRALGLDGVEFSKIDPAAAIAACASAIAETPTVARLQFSLGRALNAGKRNTEALAAYRKAAGLGDATAMNNIGAMYNTGDLDRVDEAVAVVWFRKSATAGDVTGMYNLAANLWSGKGVTANPSDAFVWMKRSAESGYARAMTALGAMYEGGVGTAKSEETALDWYKKAAAAEDHQAFYSLAVMLDAGRGTPVNTEQAADFFVAAIGFGVAEAKRDTDGGAIQWSDAFRRAVQRRLRDKIKVYDGQIDGVFGSGVKAAIGKVFGAAN